VSDNREGVLLPLNGRGSWRDQFPSATERVLMQKILTVASDPRSYAAH